MLKRKWVITLIGITVLSILIWFGGPYIAIAERALLASSVVRLLLILGLVLAWGVHNLRQGMQVKSANENMAHELLRDAPAAGASPDEVAVLNTYFKEAINTLRRSAGSGARYSKQYLYELPWYIIIGPPGSGKTTALMNSGLNFPLESRFGRSAIQGVGGTRHCDWWFTDQAVLIDTAGRYTTQDSHSSSDAAAWEGFVGLLKKYRRRRPINGVLVTMGVDELCQKSDVERATNANAVRARLQELKDQLAVNFPVYLLLTKCDLIPGFNQYFELMGKEERAQVWGMTFPEQPEQGQGYHSLFEQEYDLLAMRLHDGVLSKFHCERDYRRRADILAFPAQFEKMKSEFAEFVGSAFGESRFHDHFFLRGVYFTSGTQEGTGMQRLMQNVAGKMGFDQASLSVAPTFAASTQGKSYFIHNLFQKLVFAESELVAANRGYETNMRWARNIGYGMTLTVAAGMAALWSTSYGLNESRLNQVQQHVDQYIAQKTLLTGTEKPDQVTSVMQPLGALSAIYQPQKDGWNLRFGLYQGNALNEQVAAEYERTIRKYFYRSLHNQLAFQITQNQGVPEYLHHALKAYLMLSLPERLDKRYVETWLRADWQNRYAGQPDQLSALNQHLDRWMEMDWPVLPADDALVENSRRALRQVPLAQQIYVSLQSKAKKRAATEYRFDRQIGQGMHKVFSGEFVAIPWFYTAEGYHDFFKPQQSNLIKDLADDSWVVGLRNQDMSELDLANVQAEIEKRYLQDYIWYWQSAILRLQLRPSQSLQEHVYLLNEMVSAGSPLRQVLDELTIHTQLSKPLFDTDALAESVDGAGKLAAMAGPKASKLNRIASLAGRSRMMQLPSNPGSLVDQHFEPLHDLMRDHDTQTAPYERVVAALTELQFYLEGITSSGSIQQSAFDAALARMHNGRTDPIGKLKIEARHLPDPVRHWIETLTERAWSHTLAASREHIATEYRTMVLPFYKRSVAGRYPVNKQAVVDVTLTDFAEFFKPGGIEQQFFEQYLQPFVDTRKSPWRVRTVDRAGLAIRKQALIAFEQAALIRKVFFVDSDLPQVSFKLRAIYLDANINRFELNLLGEHLEYRHGPARRNEVSWPSTPEAESVRYVFEDHYGIQFSNQVSGEWGLFRFLDQFPLAKTGYTDRFKLTVQDDERKAVYELHANSANNPFANDYLGRFHLPNAL